MDSEIVFKLIEQRKDLALNDIVRSIILISEQKSYHTIRKWIPHNPYESSPILLNLYQFRPILLDPEALIKVPLRSNESIL